MAWHEVKMAGGWKQETDLRLTPPLTAPPLVALPLKALSSFLTCLDRPFLKRLWLSPVTAP